MAEPGGETFSPCRSVPISKRPRVQPSIVIDHFERVGRKRLGDVLVDEKLIAKEQLHEAVGERQRSGSPLGQILVDSGYLSEWDLAKAVAAHYNLPYLDLGGYEPRAPAYDNFPADLAHREFLLPFDVFGKVLCLACAEMPPVDVLRRVLEITGLTPCLYVCLGSELKRLLLRHIPAPAPEIPELVPPSNGETLDELLIDDSEKQGWEKLFDLANEEVLKRSDDA